MQFSLSTFQNEYLPEGGREVNAIVTVTASSTGGPASPGSGPAGSGLADSGATGSGTTGAAPTGVSEVIMVDCSSSMAYPRDKINAAKQATAAAIDALRDGVHFAVIAGTDLAEMVYPTTEQLVELTPRTRLIAKATVEGLQAKGGTAIGQWLALANRLFAARPDDIRHGLLLTDGRNEHEKPHQLDAVLAACQGKFTCDCRGVGTDWEVAELRKIATALLGSVEIVAEPAGLEADFRAITANAMTKAVGNVVLRVWSPKGASVRFVKQVAPTVVDLSDRRTVPDPDRPLIGDYPTGAWGTESRDYHVCVEVRPGQVGDEMLAGRRFGEATTRARRTIHRQFPQHNTWGAYQCYGDPEFVLARGTQDGESRPPVCLRELVVEAETIASDAKTAARPTRATAVHRLLACAASMIGNTAAAHTSIAVFRAALTVHPRFSSQDDSHPPPMLPTSAMRYIATSGGPKPLPSSTDHCSCGSKLSGGALSLHTGSSNFSPSALIEHARLYPSTPELR